MGRSRCKCPLRTVICSENQLLQSLPQKQYELPGTAKETKHLNGRFWMQQTSSMASRGANPLQRGAASCTVHTASHPTQWCALWTLLSQPASDKLLLRQQRLLVCSPPPCTRIQESVALMVPHTLLKPRVTLESSSLPPSSQMCRSTPTASHFHD